MRPDDDCLLCFWDSVVVVMLGFLSPKIFIMLLLPSLKALNNAFRRYSEHHPSIHTEYIMIRVIPFAGRNQCSMYVSMPLPTTQEVAIYYLPGTILL